MALTFPNQCRTYEAERNGVTFWAYDEVIEVTFVVDASMLCVPQSWSQPSEADVLGAFDLHRPKIHALAQRVYVRHQHRKYLLTADLCRDINDA